MFGHHYTYCDPVAEDAKQHRQQQRINGPAAWAAEHGGACPFCGTHDGWLHWEREQFEDTPLQAVETFWQKNGEPCSPCPECRTDYEGYEEMSHADVLAWLKEE